ncbi:MAG: putative transporter ATP-binding protein YxlF [Acidobacteriota bacterium]
MRIEVENLTHDYRVGLFRHRRRRALESVSFSVDEGTVLGLLGPNGAGKTTVFRSVLGLIRPTAGVVRVGGFAPATAAWKSALGYLPENPVQFEHLTTLEFVTSGGRLCGLDRREVEERARILLQRMGIAPVARQLLRHLSKGLRQRVGLAQALINRPRVLLLDEPMSGLDPLARRLVRSLLVEARASGTTIIFSSHNLVEVETLADQVVLLIGGRVTAAGMVATILRGRRAGLEVVAAGVDPARSGRLAAIAPDADLTGGTIRLHLPDDGLLPEVVAVVQAGGGHIISVESPRRSLEEWYIERMAEVSPPIDLSRQFF